MEATYSRNPAPRRFYWAAFCPVVLSLWVSIVLAETLVCRREHGGDVLSWGLGVFRIIDKIPVPLRLRGKLLDVLGDLRSSAVR